MRTTSPGRCFNSISDLRENAVSDLRLLSYLAPGLPEGLFDAVATRIAEATGRATSLRFVTRISAPPRGESDPFSLGEADIGFLCSPGYVWMTELQLPAVRLLAAAPVFDDPRTERRPAYFSDVIVTHRSPALRFEDLRGGTWAFNDPCSWSGYLNLLGRLRDVGVAPFFRVLRESGSHIQPVRLVSAGEVDGATVALLGAGTMGSGMAQRMLDLGFPVNVWNRTPGQVIALTKHGATARAKPTEAAAASEVVVTMLSNADAVADVMLGAGTLEALRAHATWA